jgi:hypothetical protein
LPPVPSQTVAAISLRLFLCRFDQAADVALGKSRDPDSVTRVVAFERGNRGMKSSSRCNLCIAEAAEQKDMRVPQLRGKEFEKQERRLASAMQVVDDQNEGLPRCRVPQERGHAVE